MNAVDELFSVQNQIRILDEKNRKEDIIELHKRDINNFQKYLRRENLADATVKAYGNAVRYYYDQHKSITKNYLLVYKASMLDNYSPRTINQRIQGINRYLEYIHKSSLKLKFVKVQSKPFLDSVVSNADYKILCRHLKKSGRTTFYFFDKIYVLYRSESIRSNSI